MLLQCPVNILRGFVFTPPELFNIDLKKYFILCERLCKVNKGAILTPGRA